MQESRRLVLVRHAEAEQSAPTDEQRPLTDAGRRAAAAVGTWLADVGVTPDHALVSSALRARQTWDELASGPGWDLVPDSSPVLYSAEPDTVVDLLREVPARARTVVVVGHNPTMASLAQTLDDGTGEQEAQQLLLTGGFPPCTTAVFEYDGEWAELDLTSARPVAVRVG